MYATKLFALTGISLFSTLAFGVTPPPTCQYKVFIDGYPDSGCVVPNTGPVEVSLADSIFVAPGECKDTSEPILSFRDAISNDVKAKTCTLTAYSAKGCTGAPFAEQPHVEANENQCVEYSLASGNALGARSFGLKC